MSRLVKPLCLILFGYPNARGKGRNYFYDDVSGNNRKSNRSQTTLGLNNQLIGPVFSIYSQASKLAFPTKVRDQ